MRKDILNIAEYKTLNRAGRQREADAFNVWRYCRSQRWNCSLAEVAEATGLSPRHVRSLCRERRWGPLEREGGGENLAEEVDTLMRGGVVV